MHCGWTGGSVCVRCLPFLPPSQVADAQPDAKPTIERLVESAGVSMGPIALTFGSDERNGDDASTSGTCVMGLHVQ